MAEVEGADTFCPFKSSESINKLVINSTTRTDGTARDYCHLIIGRDDKVVYDMYFNALPNSNLDRNISF